MNPDKSTDSRAASSRQLGARPTGEGQTQFVVWAPHRARVDVLLLEDPPRTVPLEPVGDGYFAAVVDRAGPGTRYFYRLDDGPKRPDPASRFQPEGVHGPSEIVDPAFAWHDAAWPGLKLRDYVLYELHVGTFSAAGTFAGLIDELDALVELGVTAVELMPVAQFPGGRNWGYDGVHPFAVQNTYGGPLEFKRFVDACHARGLAVVLDVVLNHLGPEGNYLADFGPYFTSQHQTPWGPAINFAGPDSDPVRRFFVDNALVWIREFHVDALRLDAIHAIVDQSARPFLAELVDAVHAAADELGRPVYLIAENNRNDPRIFQSPTAGGYGLDAQWLDDFGRALQALLTGERNGFYADFGLVGDLAKAWQSGYVLSGQYSHYRRRRHGADSSDVPCQRFFVYAQTHDQIGNRPQSDRLSTLVDFDRLKLAAATRLLSPYQPLLFMGEEYGETAPFHYFVSHLDADLVGRVRAGRRREFASFDWQSEPADPQAESTFAASRLDQTLRRLGWHGRLWDFHRELLKLRRELAPLREPTRENSRNEWSEEHGLLLSARHGGGVEVAILLHFAPQSVMLPPSSLFAGGNWQKCFDSHDSRWLDAAEPVPAPDRWDPSTDLPVGPWEAVVYRRNP